MHLQESAREARLPQDPETDELDLSVTDICHQGVRLHESPLRPRISDPKAGRF